MSITYAYYSKWCNAKLFDNALRLTDNRRMSARISSATEKAIALVQAGATRYAAAKQCGIALSTIYRAMPELNRAKLDQPIATGQTISV